MPSPPVNSPFQALQDSVFAITTDIMGFAAEWTPTAGGETYTARVHFKNPTKEARLSGIVFDPDAWQCEYKFGDFPGLKELVDTRGPAEIIEIDGSEYNVVAVATDWDGKTYIAYLKPVSA